jgi:hypothetical protein
VRQIGETFILRRKLASGASCALNLTNPNGVTILSCQTRSAHPAPAAARSERWFRFAASARRSYRRLGCGVLTRIEWI